MPLKKAKTCQKFILNYPFNKNNNKKKKNNNKKTLVGERVNRFV